MLTAGRIGVTRSPAYRITKSWKARSAEPQPARLRDAADAPPGEPARPAGGFRERRRLTLLMPLQISVSAISGSAPSASAPGPARVAIFRFACACRWSNGYTCYGSAPAGMICNLCARKHKPVSTAVGSRDFAWQRLGSTLDKPRARACRQSGYRRRQFAPARGRHW